MKTVKLKYSIVLGLVIWTLFGIVGAAATLTSVKVTTAPVIDGTPESLWDKAAAATVMVAGGAIVKSLNNRKLVF